MDQFPPPPPNPAPGSMLDAVLLGLSQLRSRGGWDALRALAERVTDAVVFLERDRVVYANPAAAHRLEARPGQAWTALLREEPELAHWIQSGTCGTTAAGVRVPGSGPVPGEVTLVPAGPAVALVIRARSGPELGAAELAGTVAPQLSALLAVLLGNTQRLQSALPEDAAARPALQDLAAAARRLAALTGQLAGLAGLPADPPVTLEVPALLAELRPRLAGAMPPGVSLELVQDPRVPAVRAHRLVLEEALVDLVRHAAAGPGHVVLLTRPVSGVRTGVELRVVASGAREDRTVPGLGIPVLRAFLEQSGGSVEANVSGSTLFLPAAEAAPPEQAAERLTVLVVDDDESVRAMVRRVLASRSHRVLEASHGQEALERLRDHPPGSVDLVVTDVVMPVMDGPALVAHLRCTRPDLPVLAMSAGSDHTTAGELDPDVPFLPKPFTPPDLLAMVHTAREHHRQRVDPAPVPSAGVAPFPLPAPPVASTPVPPSRGPNLS